MVLAAETHACFASMPALTDESIGQTGTRSVSYEWTGTQNGKTGIANEWIGTQTGKPSVVCEWTGTPNGKFGVAYARTGTQDGTTRIIYECRHIRDHLFCFFSLICTPPGGAPLSNPSA
jgi:hypothetical protein